MRLEKYEQRNENGQMKVFFEVWDEDGFVERHKTIPPQEDDLRSALKEEYDIE